MRVCMLTRTFHPRISGPASVVLRVSKGLVKQGYEVGVVTQHVKGAPYYERFHGIEVFRAPCLHIGDEFSFINLLIAGTFMTYKVLAKLKEYDIFHAHDISLAGLAGFLSKRFSKKPFLLKYGGDLVFEYISLKSPKGWDPRRGVEEALAYTDLRCRLMSKLQQAYMNRYDMILPDSEYGKCLLLKMGVPSKKIRVLFNGVDTEKFKRTNERIFGDKKIILTAARLVPWKGVDLLIKAMPIVLREHQDAKLVIIGEGPEFQNLKSLSRNFGLDNNIYFLGRVEVDRMPKYLSSCDVFVLPSFFDTTPNILLEAMACECSVIVSDIDGIREVVMDDCAVKVPVGDHKLLAEGIIKVLSDEKFSISLQKNGRRRVLESFSWKSVMQNYLRLYEEMQSKMK